MLASYKNDMDATHPELKNTYHKSFFCLSDSLSSTISNPIDRAVALTDLHTLSRGSSTLWVSAFFTLAISYKAFNPTCVFGPHWVGHFQVIRAKWNTAEAVK